MYPVKQLDTTWGLRGHVLTHSPQYCSFCAVLMVVIIDTQSTLDFDSYRGVIIQPTHLSPAKIPAGVGFLWIKPHLHPAAKAFLTLEIPEKTLRDNRINPERQFPWNHFMYSLTFVCFDLTKHDFCLFTVPSVFLCVCEY